MDREDRTPRQGIQGTRLRRVIDLRDQAPSSNVSASSRAGSESEVGGGDLEGRPVQQRGTGEDSGEDAGGPAETGVESEARPVPRAGVIKMTEDVAPRTREPPSSSFAVRAASPR